MKRELTNRELLDRYLHSMMLLLPRDRAVDIGAEIRSSLESLAEDRATELGRELRPEEMSAILKQRGHPAMVAIPYRDPNMRGLISPWFFPSYQFALHVSLSVWVTVRVIIAVFVFQGATPSAEILWKLGRDILLAGFLIPSGVTWIFAVWEYLYFRFRLWERWKPESLPPVPRSVQQPQPRRATEIVGGVGWLSFWAMMLFVPELSWVWGGRGVFSPSDTLSTMRLPLLLLAIFWTSQNWLKFTRFAAVEWRPFLHMAVIAAGWVMTFLVLRTGDLVVAGPNWDLSQAKSLATLNQMVAGMLVLACLFAGPVFVHELRRLLRRGGRNQQTAGSTS
jgi:hypothetical protein